LSHLSQFLLQIDPFFFELFNLQKQKKSNSFNSYFSMQKKNLPKYLYARKPFYLNQLCKM